MRGPEPQVAVRPRSTAELASTLDGIEVVFASANREGRYEQASLAAEQVLVAYELALSARMSELVSGIAFVEALRGQVLCRYIVAVRKAVEDAAGPVRELYAAIEERSEREVRELAGCAVGALRELVGVAEAVP